MQVCADLSMNAATNSTPSLQLRRGSSSPLKTEVHVENVRLEDYPPLQESDISADYCASDMHSPSSVNSSESSTKFLPQSDRNHSDLSDDCSCPDNKREKSFSDIEMTPSSSKQPTSEYENREYEECEPTAAIDYLSRETHQSEEDDNLADEEIISEEKRSIKRQSLDEDLQKGSDSTNENKEQKQMADIVGEASSPGEFFEHALEFIKSGRQSGTFQHERWATKDLNNYKFHEHNNSISKHGKRNRSHERNFVEKTNSTNDLINTEREHCLSKESVTKQSYHNPPAPLTSDEKFFVDAFKREVASAAERAAENSAIRVLGLLEASGISFKRAAYGLEHYARHSTPLTSPNLSKDKKGEVEHPHASSPILLAKSSNKTKGKHSNTYSHLYNSEDAERQIRTSSQSQLCFGSVQVNSVGSSKTAIDNEMSNVAHGRPRIDLDEVSPRRESHLVSRTESVEASEEQTQALSLVTTKSSSLDTDVDIKNTTSPSTLSSVSKLTLPVSRPPIFGPFVRHPFVSTLPTMPISSAFPNPASVGYPMNQISKFLPASTESFYSDITGPSSKRSRTSDLNPFLLEASHALRSKEKVRTRTSPVGVENRRLSPSFDIKRQHFMPASLAFGNSAYRKHEAARSPPSTAQHCGVRALRNGSSPDRKPFQPPLGLMYPFPGLPLLPGFAQSTQFAAALASISHARRNGIPEFQDIANGSTGLLDNRMALHQSLRNHHVREGNFMAGHSSMPIREGYDVDSSNYAFPSNMQEGLTPQHLKKAKLIFFYTRYPNANILKAYFPDVKFTRAITSQLIKWFSNFREFFYIQMEKFARQAVTEGVIDPCHLRVSRDSEVFRVLNLHYNKCNEFYVPEKFLHATESSQREFFSAVRAGKDCDPAWKKVIYKLICKLDAEIPEIFKSPNVLDRLHEIRD